MEDGDSVIEHLNAFNTLVSQLGYVNITLGEEDTCITFYVIWQTPRIIWL